MSVLPEGSFELRPGDLVDGRYEVHRELGRGGMGVVYQVFDRADRIEVALKTIRDLRQLHGERLYHLKQEFRRIADLRHPNLVRLHHLDISSQHCFFTMELVEGSSLLEHLCGQGKRAHLDETGLMRLCDATTQLVAGLTELHHNGRVHRDIKPSNVMVTPAGRVVVLDFGLAMTLDWEASRPGFAGTPAFMSPEQMTWQPVTPASDWFSVGVVLYRLITGVMPFRDHDQIRGHCPRTTERVEDVPVALDDVIHALLHPQPEQRPGGREVLAAFQERGRAAHRIAEPKPQTRAAPFVGREDELAQLERHLQTVFTGRSVVARIRGESGIGKTGLMRAFSERVLRGGRAPVFMGRCHPQETVPFRAVDPLVDQLSRYLFELEDGAAELVPRYTSRLVRLFPVLSRVADLARAAENEAHEMLTEGSAQESERQALWALREILAKIADRRGAVILWIDDAQWGDIGSARVLEQLLSPPDPPRLLVVLTYRAQQQPDTGFLTALEEAAKRLAGSKGLAGDREGVIFPAPIELGPLRIDDVAKVVDAVFPHDRPERLRDVTEIVAETGGSPFLLFELSTHLQDAESARQDGSTFRLEDAIHRRLSALEPKERELVRLVAISGRPLDRNLALEIGGVDSGGDRLIADLCARSILKRVSALDHETLEIYHDRIRETFLAEIEGSAEVQDGHRLLAEALQRQLPRALTLALIARQTGDTDASPSEDLALALKEVARTRGTVQVAALVEHLVGAGESTRAAVAADLGARVAGLQLQFDREAELLELAVNHLGADSPDAWKLMARRGEAFANAGRGREAGEVFERAAEARAKGAADRLADERTRLLSRAGSQYLNSGYLNEGSRVLRGVLGDLDIPVPANARAARRASLRMRLRFLRYGLSFDDRPARAISTRDELRLETAFGANVGLSMLDYAWSDAIGIWRLLQILRLGANSHLPRALAMEASTEAAWGGSWLWARSERLLDAAERLAETGTPLERATVFCCRSSLYYYRGCWEPALLHARKALEELTACPEQTHAIAVTNAYLMGAVAQMGDLRWIAEHRDGLLDDARHRGDVFSLNLLQSAEFVLVRLAQDQPDDAVRAADGILGSFESDHFTSQHYHHLIAAVKAHLYAGRGSEAWKLVDDESWQKVEDSGFLKLVFIGAHLRYHHACAALGAAHAGASGGTGGGRSSIEREHQLSVARMEARRIQRAPLPCAAAWSQAIRAGIASLTGGDAGPPLESARAGFADSSMLLHAKAAEICLARVRGEPASAAEAWMHEEQGVAKPLEMARALVPVLV